jgi:hypothetical protein
MARVWAEQVGRVTGMTEETIETPEPLVEVESPPEVESAAAPPPQTWSAAKALEAFVFKGSERFSAALVLGLSAAAIMPAPPARETFAAAAPQTALVQVAAPERAAAPPIQFSEAPSSTAAAETARAKPVLKGRPKVTLKDKWAKYKNVIYLRAVKDAPREDVASIYEAEITILTTQAPAIQIAARTAKRETAIINAAKQEAAVQASPLPDAKQAPVNVWPDEAIKAARTTCETLLKGTTAKFRILEPMKEGTCGTPAPISLQSAGDTSVAFHPALTINCEAAAALASWIDKEVQPAAKEAFGVPVKRLLSASSYSCRNRYGRKDAPLSEHATANAIDISGFVLADGRTIKVAESWGPTERDAKIADAKKPTEPDIKIAEAQPPKTKPIEVELMPRHPDYKHQQLSKLGAGDVAAVPARKSAKVTGGPRVLGAVQAAEDKRSQFLKRVHGNACGIFGTVLGPEANNAHRDHLHLDMKSRGKAFCE